MNTIEVGSVVKLADELFYAIDSTRMASIEYGIVNSKWTHISEVNHGGTIIEFFPHLAETTILGCFITLSPLLLLCT